MSSTGTETQAMYGYCIGLWAQTCMASSLVGSRMSALRGVRPFCGLWQPAPACPASAASLPGASLCSSCRMGRPKARVLPEPCMPGSGNQPPASRCTAPRGPWAGHMPESGTEPACAMRQSRPASWALAPPRERSTPLANSIANAPTLQSFWQNCVKASFKPAAERIPLRSSSAHRLRCSNDVSTVPDGRQQALALDGCGLLKPQACDCCDHP